MVLAEKRIVTNNTSVLAVMLEYFSRQESHLYQELRTNDMSGTAGVDVIVSAIGGGGLGDQFQMLEAAKAAGVKRFVPSEFGVDMTLIP